MKLFFRRPHRNKIPVVQLVALASVLQFGLLTADAASTERVLYRFQGNADGFDPAGNLVLDKAGNIYGVTSGGGTNGLGTVYKLSHASGQWKHTVLYSFGGPPADGEYPLAGLVIDNQGNLYGTTSLGGNPCGNTTCGVVFEVDSNGVEHVIYRFNGNDGLRPTGTLVFDRKGHLFGTTQDGGDGHSGNVFQLSKSGGVWTARVLYAFTGESGNGDGSTPLAGVVLDQQENVYGTTYFGGLQNATDGCGTVFELQKKSGNWNQSQLYDFTCGTDGGGPVAALVMHDGNLFGTTYWDGTIHGGRGGYGVVFELTPNSGGWSETVLYSFTAHPDGRSPQDGVIFDNAGNIYGTTFYGGWRYCNPPVLGCGTIYKLTPSAGTWQESVVYRFNGKGVRDGAYPTGTLTQDLSGHIYGATERGGSGCEPVGCGVVYEFTP
jgi:uncharacterized repeat protein (TIGR03803 family)